MNFKDMLLLYGKRDYYCNVSVGRLLLSGAIADIIVVNCNLLKKWIIY